MCKLIAQFIMILYLFRIDFVNTVLSQPTLLTGACTAVTNDILTGEFHLYLLLHRLISSSFTFTFNSNSLLALLLTRIPVLKIVGL